MNVRQLTKALTHEPARVDAPGFTVRNFSDSQDVDAWIGVQQSSFRTSNPTARPWSRDEFRRQMLDQSWWSPARQWFAESIESAETVGTVTLAMREGKQELRPVVHWLAVVPKWRRLGIARALLSNLERYCWDHELRQVWLETHKGWREAAGLYQALGYSYSFNCLDER